jgi:hypothetical protein
MRPGSYLVRSHVHPRQEERFVVLEGRFGYQIGDHEGVGRPGETLACPVAVPDSQRNPAMGDAHPLRAPPGAHVGRDLLQDLLRAQSRWQALGEGDMNLLQTAVLLQEVGDFILPAVPSPALQGPLFGALAAIGHRRGYRPRYPRYALPTRPRDATGGLARRRTRPGVTERAPAPAATLKSRSVVYRHDDARCSRASGVRCRA